MKGSELIRLLKRKGARLISHGSGHDEWELKGNKTFVPRHKNEIATGTVKTILKDLKIEK